MPKPVRKPNGLEFPLDAKGGRSTTAINQATYVAAIQSVSEAAAESAKKQRGWRFAYKKHLIKQVEIAAQSPDNALKIAKAGLDHLHDQFEFIRDDKTMSLKDAMKSLSKDSFETGTIKGSQPKPESYELEVPYNGKVLKGDELRVTIGKWVSSGLIELSTGSSLTKVCDTPEWLDMSDKYVVLLGASSAMGPLPLLLSLGANVIAIDLDRPFIWSKLIKQARASCGTLIFPLKKPQKDCKDDEELFENAGSDLLAATPEIRNWLLKVCPGKPLTVGAYAYLDGPLFVRVSMAMDAIIEDLVAARKVSLAYLCTPTDAHLVPAASVQGAKNNLRRAPIWQHLFAGLLGCTKFRMDKNFRRPVLADDGQNQYVNDAVVIQQGPNYILAKRLQHWRAVLSRQAGCVVSTNIAPTTATASVVSNLSFKVAFGGMKYFKPIEIFMQDTSNAVMGGLLINDLRNPLSAAHPATPLRNPMNLFSENGFHGGAWRTAYTFGSLGAPSVLAYLFVNFIVGAYMVAYNSMQAAGWGYALYKVLSHALGGAAAGGAEATLWAAAGPVVHVLTMLTGLEIVHPMLGMVRAGLFTTAIQVLSRVILAVVVHYTPATQNVPWLYMMCFAWSLTEVVRYSFYAAGLLGLKIKPLTWLRYTLFLALYPLGVSGEIGCLYHAMKAGVLGSPALAEAPAMMKYFIQPLFERMPFWVFVVLAYGPGLPMLYGHMLTQRKKVLGGKRVTDKKKKQ